jgi:flavorubredoxin
MKPVEIVKGVHWCGALHPDLKMFDDLMQTKNGTTYNAYFVRGERTAVIDTVKVLFADEYMENLATLVDPKELDVIVVNHTEPDHSGTLERLLSVATKAKVYCSRAAKLYLKNLLNREVECLCIEEVGEVDLGGKTLKFISAPFLHWPDTIFTWLPEDRILFPCDGFATHFCDERMFNDQTADFEKEFATYYDAIMRPYRDKVHDAVEHIADLDIQVICPSHGPMLRKDPRRYVEKYREWTTLPERGKPYIAVIYATAHHNTQRVIEAVIEGLRRVDVDVDLIHATDADDATIRRALEEADGLLFGSPTIVRDLPPIMWRVLSYLSTVKVRAGKAAALGSYGWSGEAVKFIEQRLKDMRLPVMEPGLRWKFTPTEEDLEQARKFGEEFAAAVSAG